MSKRTQNSGLLARNRRATFDYEILEKLEAGIVLAGTEVKAIRAGKIQLREAHVEFRGDEAWLVGAHVSPYSHGNRANHEPERPRKLLLHRREIERWRGKSQEKGTTVVPLDVHLSGNHIKVELALARGKQMHDKRRAIRERELDREAEQAMRGRARG